MCSHQNRLIEAILMSTHYILFPNTKKKKTKTKKKKKQKIILNYPKSAAMGFVPIIPNLQLCSKGPKNEFETAVVYQPPVFEPMKFYCSPQTDQLLFHRSSNNFVYNVNRYEISHLYCVQIYNGNEETYPFEKFANVLAETHNWSIVLHKSNVK